MEGKHIDARWFRDLWAFVDISNRIQSGEMPKVDANGTPIESEGAGAEVGAIARRFLIPSSGGCELALNGAEKCCIELKTSELWVRCPSETATVSCVVPAIVGGATP